MKHLKVLGSGCANCVKTAELIENTAQEQEVDVTVEKVTDLTAIMSYGVMSTPAVVLDEEVIHSGSVPTKEMIMAWLDK
jgi:small redox-active disulfide protein 2